MDPNMEMVIYSVNDEEYCTLPTEEMADEMDDEMWLSGQVIESDENDVPIVWEGEQPPRGLTVFVEMPDGKVAEVKLEGFEPNSFVDDMFERIENITNVKVEEQLIVHHERVLMPNRRLSEYGIEDGSYMEMQINEGAWKLNVKFQSGQIVEVYPLWPTSLISEVMVKTQDIVREPIRQQSLFFAGIQLSDGCMLQDYEVQNGAELQMGSV